MDIPLLLALWLHTLAFVIAWGYYGILGRVVLPALGESPDRAAGTAMLVAIERRALPLVLISVALFIATGTWLLVVNDHYAGLGDVFANTWATLMLLKHLTVILLVALGIAVEILVRRVAGATDDASRSAALRRLRLSAEGATGLGALVVLLTAAAQLSA
jgi:uncharacterized membrane protein